MFNAHRISLKLSEVKIFNVLSYAPCREGVWRSGSVAPRTLNPCTVVGIVTAVWAGRSDFRISAGAKDVSVLRIVQTGSGVHPAPCSVGTWIPCRE